MIIRAPVAHLYTAHTQGPFFRRVFGPPFASGAWQIGCYSFAHEEGNGAAQGEL